MTNKFRIFLILIICCTTFVNGQLKSNKDSIVTNTQIGTINYDDTQYHDLGDTIIKFDRSKPVYGLEVMPEFPGGSDSLYAFIERHLDYSNLNHSINLEGRVVIRVIITKKGSIKDVTVIRGLEQSYDKEAVRVISRLPKWIPGQQNGRKTPVYYTIHVVFRHRNDR